MGKQVNGKALVLQDDLLATVHGQSVASLVLLGGQCQASSIGGRSLVDITVLSIDVANQKVLRAQ